MSTLTRLCLSLCLASTLDSLAAPTARFVEPAGPINLFGGAETNVAVLVQSQQVLDGRLMWRVAANNRTLDRGEIAVNMAAREVATIAVPLRVQDVKPGVVFGATLSLDLAGKGESSLAHADVPLYVFSDEVFEGRREWLKKLPVCLFDPEERTAKVLDRADVEYQRQSNVDSLSETAKGVLIIGEGVSFREYRGLWKMLIDVARKGVPVLCLAPAEGELDLSAMSGIDEGPRAARIELRSADVIRDLDKRLAVEACLHQRPTGARRLTLRGDRGPVLIDVIPGDGGWQWIELGFRAPHAQIVVCGFPLIENWRQNPAPRYLLLRMLEYVSSTPDTGKKSREKEAGGRP